MPRKISKVLLYSGGMDSYLIDKILKPDHKLFFDIGTKQNEQEKKRLPKDVIIKKIDLAEYVQDDNLLTIPLRNLIFLSIAVNYADTIILGTTADDLHYDKKEKFIKATQKLFNSVLTKELVAKKIKIEIPYQDKSKIEILNEYLKLGGDIEKAYQECFSCHFPKDSQECLECIPCKKKIDTFKMFGYEI